jgi:hypothetical protein
MSMVIYLTKFFWLVLRPFVWHIGLEAGQTDFSSSICPDWVK